MNSLTINNNQLKAIEKGLHLFIHKCNINLSHPINNDIVTSYYNQKKYLAFKILKKGNNKLMLSLGLKETKLLLTSLETLSGASIYYRTNGILTLKNKIISAIQAQQAESTPKPPVKFIKFVLQSEVLGAIGNNKTNN